MEGGHVNIVKCILETGRGAWNIVRFPGKDEKSRYEAIKLVDIAKEYERWDVFLELFETWNKSEKGSLKRCLPSEIWEELGAFFDEYKTTTATLRALKQYGNFLLLFLSRNIQANVDFANLRAKIERNFQRSTS